jgi:hypothetical protein
MRLADDGELVVEIGRSQILLIARCAKETAREEHDDDGADGTTDHGWIVS